MGLLSHLLTSTLLLVIHLVFFHSCCCVVVADAHACALVTCHSIFVVNIEGGQSLRIEGIGLISLDTLILLLVRTVVVLLHDHLLLLRWWLEVYLKFACCVILRRRLLRLDCQKIVCFIFSKALHFLL